MQVGPPTSPRGRKTFVRSQDRPSSISDPAVLKGTLPEGTPVKTDIKVTIELVTPEIAEAWLQANTHNRRRKVRNIERMVRDIKSDRWALNGESIKFATVRDHEVLVDGQNRLLAIVESETAVPTIVVRGLSIRDQESVDVGARRILRDMLEMRGEVNCTVLAAGLVALWQYEQFPDHPGRRNDADYPSVQQALDVLERHPAFRESTKYAANSLKDVHVPPSIGSALHYLTMTKDPADAMFFWDKLETGLELQKDDPIYVLREFMRRDYESHYGRRNTYELWAIITKAWNAYREGRKINALRFVAGGAKPEQFPEMK